MTAKAVVVWTCLGSALYAQEPDAPDLALILQGIRKHVVNLETSIPDFICQEQIVSQFYLATKAKKTTRAESVLTTSRVPKGRRGTFSEARTEMKINGKKTRRNEIAGPFVWHGGPSYGFLEYLFNSERGQVCMVRELKGEVKLDGKPALLLVAHASLNADSDPRCGNVRLDASDQVWLEPGTFNVVRIESFNPPTTSIPGSDLTLIVDYAPVVFDDIEYWLPSHLLSRLDFPGTPKHLRYEAFFTGYHKFGVASVIHIDPVQ